MGNDFLAKDVLRVIQMEDRVFFAIVINTKNNERIVTPQLANDVINILVVEGERGYKQDVLAHLSSPIFESSSRSRSEAGRRP
jgi:hypothetical protein